MKYLKTFKINYKSKKLKTKKNEILVMLSTKNIGFQ